MSPGWLRLLVVAAIGLLVVVCFGAAVEGFQALARKGASTASGPLAESARGAGVRQRPVRSPAFCAALRLAEQGRTDEAIDAFAAVAEADPSRSDADFNRALLLARRGFHADARALLESLTERDRDAARLVAEPSRGDPAAWDEVSLRS